MTERPRHLSVALVAPAAEGPSTWIEFLKDRIKRDWRPGEFDFEELLFVPDSSNRYTLLQPCARVGCDVLLDKGDLCPTCRKEWLTVAPSGIAKDQWSISSPRARQSDVLRRCTVEGCQRDYKSNDLCRNHDSLFSRYRRSVKEATVAQWILDRRPRPYGPATRCIAEECPREASASTGLCAKHNDRFTKWCKRENRSRDESAVATWLAREVEPPMDLGTSKSYRSACATPFSLLPEPLRWEYLYAVQKRDDAGMASLRAVDIRGTYLHLRRQNWNSAVGQTRLGRQPRDCDRNLAGMLVEWQRHIDDAHREWSGVDDRDAKVIYMRDLELRRSTRRIGPKAAIDLRGIEQAWLFDTVTAWIRGGVRGYQRLKVAGAAWTLADEVLRVRGTTRSALGLADMDAIARAIRERWPSQAALRRRLALLDEVINFARADDGLQPYWEDIPGGFGVDFARHLSLGAGNALLTDRESANPDEPFRFIPQPIVDWVMDHLHLLDRGDPYLTAEARAMVFLQERCGRRTGETTRLKDDCISYDDEGAPYLEWRQGKPPFHMGKRLPIHQETHDVIREWQEIKRQHGVTSQWLFPSRRYARADKPYGTNYLPDRFSDLMQRVVTRAPYTREVEGADGNLIYFDLSSIDPYSFRHAFAQRLADATDAEGRSTTPPDVLQDYMGHKSFNTTMIYYEVSVKRRKKALAAIPPRRLNLRGQVIKVDRERDGFTRVAVTLGHCTEPQNVATGGHGCMLEHACESCPFFMVDPLERDGMEAKRHDLRVKLERARVIRSPQHMIDHYTARIDDCSRIVDGIDAYIDNLPTEERDNIREALDHMADIRRRATAPRRIDLRAILTQATPVGV